MAVSFSYFLFLKYEAISLAESMCIYASLGNSGARCSRREKILKVHFGE